MSPVEFWWNKLGVYGEPVGIDKAFSQPHSYPKRKSVIIVESQDEYDYCWAMQAIMGCEIDIIIDPGALPQSYYPPFSWVFTTWDPSDRNRI